MVGFPHSEILGSKLIRSSPRLIAAYYVLHRLCTPRHPLDALKTLDRSHYLYPQHHQPFALLYAYLPPSSDWFPGTKLRLVPHRTEVRCMSEKKPKITSLFYSSPRGIGSNGTESDLFTMSKYPARERYRIHASQTLLSSSRSLSLCGSR